MNVGCGQAAHSVRRLWYMPLWLKLAMKGLHRLLHHSLRSYTQCGGSRLVCCDVMGVAFVENIHSKKMLQVQRVLVGSGGCRIPGSGRLATVLNWHVSQRLPVNVQPNPIQLGNSLICGQTTSMHWHVVDWLLSSCSAQPSVMRALRHSLPAV